MALPVIPGVLRVSATGLCAGGGHWSNTWHARNDSLLGWTESGVQAFHDIFKQLYIGPALGGGFSILQQCNTGTTLIQIAYTPLDGTSNAYVHATTSAGTESVASLPAEVSFVITIRTALRGRQNRGRIYCPPFSTSHTASDGHLVASTATVVLAHLNAVEAALETGGAHLGVGSYGPYIGSGSPHFTPVQRFSMDNVADVQRHRKA